VLKTQVDGITRRERDRERYTALTYLAILRIAREDMKAVSEAIFLSHSPLSRNVAIVQRTFAAQMVCKKHLRHTSVQSISSDER
jgi:hypothetical protein